MLINKRLIGLVVFSAFILAAPKFVGNQGYVLISLGNTTVEGSIVSFTAVLMFALLAIWLLKNLTVLLFRTTILPTKWWQKRNIQNQSGKLQASLDLMAQNQWQQAYQSLLTIKSTVKPQYIEQLKTLCVNQLLAADSKLDDQQSTLLENGSANDKVRLLLANGQAQDAVAVYQQKGAAVQKWSDAEQQQWLVTMAQSFEWDKLNKALPKLDKQWQKADHSASMQKLQGVLQLGFADYINQSSMFQLQQVWQQWSAATKKIPAVAGAYVSALAQQNLTEKAQHVLLEHVSIKQNHWLLAQVRAYYQVNKSVAMDVLFEQVQKLLKKHPQDKSLLTVFAYLAAGQKDYQLSKQVLEQVIYSNDNNIDMTLYANALAELGEVRHSLDVFRKIT